jgi:hypothetical protein
MGNTRFAYQSTSLVQACNISCNGSAAALRHVDVRRRHASTDAASAGPEEPSPGAGSGLVARRRHACVRLQGVFLSQEKRLQTCQNDLAIHRCFAQHVPTKPYAGQKCGTSGLRKKVKVCVAASRLCYPCADKSRRSFSSPTTWRTSFRVSSTAFRCMISANPMLRSALAVTAASGTRRQSR